MELATPMMPPIEFRVAMFRDDADQARSQLVLLWLMEALCRVNQSLIRRSQKIVTKSSGSPSDGDYDIETLGITRPIPLLYKSGVHYEREPPGQEHWPDIVNLLCMTDGPGQFPGPWGDCEDLACWRVAELREAPEHKSDGKTVKGGVLARPYAKWRRGPEGQFMYHALVLRPDGKLEDPSLALGMRREAEFAAAGTAEKLRNGQEEVKIQFAEAPDVMVVDPDKPSGYGDNGRRASTLQGSPKKMPLGEARAKLREGTIKSYGVDLSDFLGDK